MRVIAGAYRSRLLAAPRGLATRPTSDRLRETLFSILADRVSGARFADLYAGSGAVGIEALSRGAAHVVFAERAAPAVAAIRKNLAALAVSAGYTLEERGVSAMLQGQSGAKRGAPGPGPLDLVFLDPPWEVIGEYTATLSLLGGGQGSSILARDAIVIAEHAARVTLPESFGALERFRTLKQGDAALSFYTARGRLTGPGGANPPPV